MLNSYVNRHVNKNKISCVNQLKFTTHRRRVPPTSFARYPLWP